MKLPSISGDDTGFSCAEQVANGTNIGDEIRKQRRGSGDGRASLRRIQGPESMEDMSMRVKIGDWSMGWALGGRVLTCA